MVTEPPPPRLWSLSRTPSSSVPSQASTRLAVLTSRGSAHSSRFVGVVFDEGRLARAPWCAWVTLGAGNRIKIARFPTEQAAAHARDRAALHLLGTNVQLNLPELHPKAASLAELRAEARAALKTTMGSRFRGVAHQPYFSEDRPWNAQIHVQPPGPTHLGRWSTEREAALAYDRAARHYWGETTTLNLPKHVSKVEPADAETLIWLSQRSRKARCVSRFIGLSWDRRKCLWRAGIRRGGRTYYLGRHKDEEAAAEAYDEMARTLLGDKAKLNFHSVTGEELLGRRVVDRVAAKGPVTRGSATGTKARGRVRRATR